MSFSKKKEFIFLGVSIILLFVGSILILFAKQCLEGFPYILENYIFHRTFDHESYKESMMSLLLFPIFISFLFSIICFVKFSDNSKCVLIIVHIISTAVVIFIISFTNAINFTEQDLSSEILLASECFQRKTFWPTTWYYSMEFRLFNTQILTAPLFLFTKDLRLIKAITVILAEAILFASTYFLLHELNIKKLWQKLLGGLLAINPASWIFFCFVQEGSYYIPHIAFSFVYLGLFISAVFHEHSALKSKLIFIVFTVLAFVSGLSSIRYILNFTFPLAAIVVLIKSRRLIIENQRFKIKQFFIEDKQTFYATYGLILSGIGYVLNSTVLASIYSFKNMNKIRFNPLSLMKLDDIVAMNLSVMGYNENVSVFTPGGIANVLLLVVAICFVSVFIFPKKLCLKDYEKLFLQFVLFMSLFSLYTNICTEMVSRYLTMVYIFFIPLLVLSMQNENVGNVKKWILGASSALLILTNSSFCFIKMQTASRSSDIQKVAHFLMDNKYEFGYAFSNTANPIWFCTNGTVEVASISADGDAINMLPEKWEIHKWLEQKKFTDIDYYKGGKNIFFAIRKDEYELSKNNDILNAGRLVYQDENYLVFDFASPLEFKNIFD